MKKRLIAGMLAIAMIISGMILNVNAATGSVSVIPSKTEVNPGDTFTVTISGSCEEGINGLEAVVTYEEAKLELVESKAADNKWIDLGQNVDTGVGISLMCNSADTIKNANMYVLTFKVKNDATVDTTAKVTASGITLYSDASQTYTEGTKEAEVSIKAKAQEPSNPSEPTTPTTPSEPSNPSESTTPTTPTEPTTPSNPSNPTNPTTPSDVTGTNTNGTSSNGTDSNGSSSNGSSTSGTSTPGKSTTSGTTTSSTSTTEKTNNSQSSDTYKSSLPKTGENDYIMIATCTAMLVFGVMSYYGYRK